MIGARGGSIISTASVASKMGGVATHAYTCSKHAILGLTRNASIELGQFGIRVNCLSPYGLSTPLSCSFVGLNDEELEKVAEGHANLKGLALKVDDAANATLFLVSDESRYVSGHNLVIDGGFSIYNPSFGLFKLLLSAIQSATTALRKMNGNSHNPSAKRLDGKVAIITGGASGFGESTARLFAQHGAKVIIADIQGDKGMHLCKELASYGNSITYVHCDVTSDSDMKNVVDTAMSKYGKLDIMFNNAGIAGSLDLTILGTNNEDFKRVFDVNVYGAFLGAKHAARVMIPTKKGVILFTSSAASVTSGEAPHAYTMSKHAVIGLMKNLCVELGQYGIRVNAISPCAVGTPLLLNAMAMDKSSVDALICESAVLKGVVPEVEDVAKAALYLASEDARLVNGLNLMVDGGYSTTNSSFGKVLNKLFP
ncbi:hypothetical protein Ancab_031571 [Ancistrocladus abbreviatus]